MKPPNNALESATPLLSRSSLPFAVNSSPRAARQSRGFHPAKRLATQRGVKRMKIND